MSAAVLVVVTALIAETVGVAIGVLIMTSRTDGGAPEKTISAAVAARQDEATFAHRAMPENISQNSTYLDHPLIDGNLDAGLSITQN